MSVCGCRPAYCVWVAVSVVSRCVPQGCVCVESWSCPDVCTGGQKTAIVCWVWNSEECQCCWWVAACALSHAPVINEAFRQMNSERTLERTGIVLICKRVVRFIEPVWVCVHQVNHWQQHWTPEHLCPLPSGLLGCRHTNKEKNYSHSTSTSVMFLFLS